MMGIVSMIFICVTLAFFACVQANRLLARVEKIEKHLGIEADSTESEKEA